MENKMQDQIEGALFHENEFYDEIMNLTKYELYDKMIQLEYQIDNLNEHGLDDSDCERVKSFINRNYNIIKKRYDEI